MISSPGLVKPFRQAFLSISSALDLTTLSGPTDRFADNAIPRVGHAHK